MHKLIITIEYYKKRMNFSCLGSEVQAYLLYYSISTKGVMLSGNSWEVYNGESDCTLCHSR